jgi:hypothetical protein
LAGCLKSSPAFPPGSGLYANEDAVSILESWMGSNPRDENTRAMVFDEIDKKLNLEPGSAGKYLESAARRWHYQVRRRGDSTILFIDE